MLLVLLEDRKHAGRRVEPGPPRADRADPDADAIADLAVGNFVEMRDLVGQTKFLVQKKIEAKCSTQYPEKWIPAYSMVTFSPDIRYSEALRNGKRQQEIMDKVMALPGIENTWESDEVTAFIISQL